MDLFLEYDKGCDDDKVKVKGNLEIIALSSLMQFSSYMYIILSEDSAWYI